MSSPSRRISSETTRQRGIVLILVLVVLLIIVVLGLMYMNTARLDGLATREMNTRFIDQAESMAIQNLSATLRLDLLGADEAFVNGAPAHFEFYDEDKPYWGSGEEWAAVAATTTDEPHDYPSTNREYPNQVDDRWLAVLAPDVVQTHGSPNLVWRHTSDVRWFWADGNDASSWQSDSRFLSEFGVQPIPDEPDPALQTADAFNHLRLDILDLDNDGTADWDPTNPDADRDGLLDFERYAADADGDGIPDSRWQYMPTRQINTVRYVWAVRVVDLAGKVNVNTASALVDSASNYVEAQRPRWDTPSELDMALLASDSAFVGGATGQTELSNLLQDRTGSGTLPTPRNVRLDYWEEMGRRMNNPATGNAYRTYGLESEIDLLYRNGLNHPERMSDLETALGGGSADGSDWLRSDELDEREWRSVSGVANITEYFQKNPRLYLTTMGGASVVHALPRAYYPNIDDGNSKGSVDRGSINHNGVGINHVIRRDLNYRKRNINRVMVEPRWLSWELRNVMERGIWNYGPTDGATDWDAIIDTYPWGWLYNAMHAEVKSKSQENFFRRRNFMANQMAASIGAYLRDDNRAVIVHHRSDYNSGDAKENMVDAMGLSRVPFITEMYVHAPYSVENTTHVGGRTWEADMSRLDGANGHRVGYAVEIYNPHDVAISLDGIYLGMMRRWDAGQFYTNFNTPTGNYGGNPYAINRYVVHLGAMQATLGPDEKIVVYHDSPAGESIIDMLYDGVAAGSRPTAYEWTSLETSTGSPAGQRRPFGDGRLDSSDAASDTYNTTGIQLHIRAQDGRIPRSPYQRIRYRRDFNWPGNYSAVRFNYGADDGSTDPDGEIFYKFSTVIGNDNGLNAMAMVDPYLGDAIPWATDYQFTTSTNVDHFNASPVPHLPVHPQLSYNGGDLTRIVDVQGMGTTSKIDAGGPPDVEFDFGSGVVNLGDEIWPHNGTGEMSSSAEIMNVVFLGPRMANEVNNPWEVRDVAWVFRSQQFQATTPGDPRPQSFLEHFMIPYNPVHATLLETDAYNRNFNHDFQRTPHYAWMMARFDPLSPVDDLVDNDGNGFTAPHGAVDRDTWRDELVAGTAYDPEESFVPGRINLNTVPYEVLRRVLPITDAVIRDRVAQRIVRFRENDANYRTATAGYPANYRQEPGIVQVGELLPLLADIFGSNNAIDATLGGITIDDRDPIDRRADDRAEQVRLVEWLNNVATTRSDTFAAYVLIRGYETDRFDRAPVEERRFYVIFDRSSVRDRWDQVTIRAVVQMNDN